MSNQVILVLDRELAEDTLVYRDTPDEVEASILQEDSYRDQLAVDMESALARFRSTGGTE